MLETNGLLPFFMTEKKNMTAVLLMAEVEK
jgi:hypothetical protein